MFKQLTKILLKTSVLGAVLMSSAFSWGFAEVKPSNDLLQYSGRIDFSDKDAPLLSWPGTSVTGKFTGQYLAVTLDDQYGKNFYNVFIDNDFSKPVVLQLIKGEKNYVVAANLKEGTHSFLLYKRTEGEEGATFFKGLSLNDNEKLLSPPAKHSRKIEFFGDSITSGMGNESPDDGPDHLIKDKNNFWAYDAITARNLNAELHVTSQSGIGIMISWFPFIMPQFYDQLSAVGNNDTQWNFSQWTPDVVVINLFQNDSWLTDREKRMNPNPTDEQRIEAYTKFVKTIRNTYPKAYIVCALGSMDATKAGSKWPGYITTAVANMKKENPNERMDTIFFEFTGYGGHPRIKQHKANAEKLTAFIKQKMGW